MFKRKKIILVILTFICLTVPTSAFADLVLVENWSMSYQDFVWVYQENVTIAQGSLDYLKVSGEAYEGTTLYSKASAYGTTEAWVEHPVRLGKNGVKYSTYGKHAYTEDGLSYIRSTNDYVVYSTPESSSTTNDLSESISIEERRNTEAEKISETVGIDESTLK